MGGAYLGEETLAIWFKTLFKILRRPGAPGIYVSNVHPAVDGAFQTGPLQWLQQHALWGWEGRAPCLPSLLRRILVDGPRQAQECPDSWRCKGVNLVQGLAESCPRTRTAMSRQAQLTHQRQNLDHIWLKASYRHGIDGDDLQVSVFLM